MGVVYKAEQTALGRTVAIKAVSDECAASPEFLARFQQEARTVAAMGSQENIVQVYDIEVYDGHYFMIMEFVDGQTLGDLLKKGRFPNINETLRIIRQTARALQHAHERKIVHRDIKPDNVMISKDGRVKVMDFGIARVTNSSVKTKTGTAIGTPQYMSPEQIRGDANLDARSDIYSLCVMLYQLVTGRLPFVDDNPFVIAVKHLQEPPVPPTVLRPDLDPIVEGIILKGMQKDPAKRYQSAAELEKELRAYEAADEATSLNPNESFLNMPRVEREEVIQRARSIAFEKSRMQRPSTPNFNSDQTMEVSIANSAHMMADQQAFNKLMTDARKAIFDEKQPQDDRQRIQPTPSPGRVATPPAHAPAQHAHDSRFAPYPPSVTHGGAPSSPAPAAHAGAALPAGKQAAKPKTKRRSGGLVLLLLVLLLAGGATAAYFMYPEQARALARQHVPDLAQQLGWMADAGPTPDGPVLPTPAPGDRPIPTATPEVPDPAELASLESKLEAGANDLAALQQLSTEVSRLSSRFPRDPQVQALSTRHASRLGRAESLQRIQREFSERVRSYQFDDARSLISSLRMIEGTEQVSNDLQRELDAAIDRRIAQLRAQISQSVQGRDASQARSVLESAQRDHPAVDWSPEAAQIQGLEVTLQDEALRQQALLALKQSYQSALDSGAIAEADAIYEQVRSRTDDEAWLSAARRNRATAVRETVVRLRQEAARLPAAEAARAVALLDEAIALDPSNLMLQRERNSIAQRVESTARIENLLTQARAQADAGAFTEALDTVQQALQMQPTNEPARSLMAVIQREQQQASRDRLISERPRLLDSPDTIARRKAQAPANFIYIPSGFYPIGSDTGDPSASPFHVLRVEGFYIGMYEVSLAEYDEFLRANPGRGRPAIVAGTAFDRPDLPVVGVSYQDALDYAQWRGARLPTEVEWEAAARTIDGYAFPIGNQFDARRANTSDNATLDGFASLAPVRSPFRDGTISDGYPEGLRSTHSMMGNVAEWTSSLFDGYPGNPGRHPLFGNPRYRVVRGGSYRSSSEEDFHAYRRVPERDANRSRNDLGLRLVIQP